jgi:hypothetical protein
MVMFMEDRPPAAETTWLQFLHDQATGILAVDFSCRHGAADTAVRIGAHRARHLPDAPGRHHPSHQGVDRAAGPQPRPGPRRGSRLQIPDPRPRLNFAVSFDAVFQATGTTIMRAAVRLRDERDPRTGRRHLAPQGPGPRSDPRPAHLRAALTEYESVNDYLQAA